MHKIQPSPLCSILWIALEMSAILFLAGCTKQSTAVVKTPGALLAESPTPASIDVRPAPTAGNESQETQIEDFVVREIAGSETEHRYIIRVNSNNLRAPLPMTKDVIQKCWLYQEGALRDCSADDFINSVSREGSDAWNYSYVIFSIVSVDPESGKATVRMDELAGPMARKGLLYALVQVNGSWQTESSRLLWSS
jgi:hypothetical protein